MGDRGPHPEIYEKTMRLLEMDAVPQKKMDAILASLCRAAGFEEFSAGENIHVEGAQAQRIFQEVLGRTIK